MRVVEISDPSSFHTEQWARQLIERGIDTHVVYVRGWYPEKDDRVRDVEGCRETIFAAPDRRVLATHLLRRGRVGSLIRSYVDRTRLYGEMEYLGPRLREYLTSNQIDVVHAHYLHSGCLLAHASGFQPTVMSTWGSDLTDGPRKYPYYVPLMREALKSATIVQTESEVSAMLVRRIYPVEESRMFVTSWGADTGVFRPDLDTRGLREKLGIPPGPVILSFRALDPYYRIDLIIRAFKMISDKHTDVSLVIGSDGLQRDDLERLCRELSISHRVFFTGRIARESVAPLFALADIYIQCPLSDGVSISSLEALAAGVPIVANDVGETRAVVEQGVNGFLLEESDKPQPYADALSFLLDDDGLRRRMADESRRLAESKHDRKKIIDRFERLFVALAQGAPDMSSIV